MATTQDRFLTDVEPSVNPMLMVGKAIGAAGILVIAPLASRGASAPLLEHLNGASEIGSGGSVAWLRDAVQTWDGEDINSLAIQYQHGAAVGKAESRAAVAENLDQEEALLHIRQVFSLNAQQMASVMGVSRSAFYKWLDGSTQMRQDKFDRLRSLRALADRWMDGAGTVCRRTRGVSREAYMGLVEVLESTEADSLGKANEMIDELLAVVRQEPPARKRVTEIAQERGWEPLPDHVVKAQMRNTIPSVRLGGEDED